MCAHELDQTDIYTNESMPRPVKHRTPRLQSKKKKNNKINATHGIIQSKTKHQKNKFSSSICYDLVLSQSVSTSTLLAAAAAAVVTMTAAFFICIAVVR